MSETAELPRTEPINNPEREMLNTVNPAVARFAVGSVERSFVEPKQHGPVSNEKKRELVEANSDALKPLIEAANQLSIADRQSSGNLENKDWNDKVWRVLKSITAQKIDSDLRQQRNDALVAVGINLDEPKTEGLYTSIEQFRKKYVDYGKSDIGQFVTDIAEGLPHDDGAVDLVALENRLTAIKSLFGVFGQDPDIRALVKDFALTSAVLDQKGEKKKKLVDQAATEVQRPVPAAETSRIKKLWDKLQQPTQAPPPHHPDRDTTKRPPNPTPSETSDQGKRTSDESESNEPLTDKEVALAQKYLLYADIPGREQTLEDSRRKIDEDRLLQASVKELALLFEEHDEDTIVEHVHGYIREMKAKLHNLGISNPRSTIDSLTWYLLPAMQSRYIAKHPGIKNLLSEPDQYTYADPFAQYKTTDAEVTDKSKKSADEILYTMLGEEIFLHNQQAPDFFSKFSPQLSEITKDEIQALLNKEPEAGGLLRAHDLRRLGELMNFQTPEPETTEQHESIVDNPNKKILTDPTTGEELRVQIYNEMLNRPDEDTNVIFQIDPAFVMPLIQGYFLDFYNIPDTDGDFVSTIVDNPDNLGKQLRIQGKLEGKRLATPVDFDARFTNEDGKIKLINKGNVAVGGNSPTKNIFQDRVEKRLGDMDTILKARLNEQLEGYSLCSVDQIQIGPDGLVLSVKEKEKED